MKGKVAFSNVAVGLPSKVRGSEAEEEWQEVDWITWSTGELSVDLDSFLLVFKPDATGSSSVKAKPLGNLIRASTVAQDEDRTLVVTTSDALHRLYRFTFSTARSANDFAALARSVEDTTAAAATRAETHGGAAASNEAIKALEADVREKFAARLPLVYGGAELYGPDPAGHSGSEVLLGSGLLVLVDPVAGPSNRLGCYELHFYTEDDGAQKAVLCLQIGPKMELKVQKSEEDTEDGEGAAVSFELPGLGGAGPSHTINFGSEVVAAGFARDYRVRQRLMEVASKTAKGVRAAADLRGEIQDMKQRSLAMRIWRFVCSLMVLMLLACAARLAMLFAEDKSRPIPEMFQALAHEIASLGTVSRGVAMKASAKACMMALGAVPADDVLLCAALPTASQVKLCVEGLVGV